jgi:hypothetical protein
MEMAELEAEASLKECAMLQRILQHRQSASGGGGGGGQDSLDSLLMRSPLPLSFQPTSTTTATTNNTPASASSKSLHQILYGINQQYPEPLSLTDDPAVDEDDGGDYPNDDADDSDGVFDLDM